MLEEGFAAAAVLNTMGFPVGVQLASRLVPDVSHFLSAYVNTVSAAFPLASGCWGLALAFGFRLLLSTFGV